MKLPYRIFLASVSFIATIGTFLSLSRRPHWIFRTWDFPRVQIAFASGVSTLFYRAYFYRRRTLERLMIALSGATVAWQIFKIRPYTPLARQRVKTASSDELSRGRSTGNTFSLMMANVMMENSNHEKLIETVRRYDPDVLLAVEVDEAWMSALESLTSSYPHVVRQPQQNYYGMVMFSRLELSDTKIQFLIQDDIPSILSRIRLNSGVEVSIHALHPRPPEPIRDQISAPRDAELVMVGRGIGDAEDAPTVVVGDLNDVAWSDTSQLFLRLSGLLDPRIGRGFFNSFNANNPLFRFPLDHVFHSHHFRLVSLQRLPSIGSDHFPLLITLLYDPDAVREQPVTQLKEGDQSEAQSKLEEQAEAAAKGADRPNEDRG